MALRLEGVTTSLEAARLAETARETQRVQTGPAAATEGGDESRVQAERFAASLVRFALEVKTEALQAFSRPACEVPSIDQRKVDEATAGIKENLKSGFFNDVTHTDLREIERTLEGLMPQEANAVFNRLTDAELRQWAEDLNDAGWFDFRGYDRNEKQRLFDTLAERLDGQNLARFAGALDEPSDGQLFGASVASRATDAATEQFIRSSAARAENDPTTAVAVAEAIGGLSNNPAALQRAVGGLSQTQIDKIVEAAAQERMHTNPLGSSITVTYDAAPLGRMLEAVSRVQDPDLKARFFEPAAAQLKELEETNTGIGLVVLKGDSERQVRDGLTALLDSDTTGVVNSLENEFRDGKGLTAYMKSMLENGQERQIGQMISRLLEGNDHSQNPIDRFGARVMRPDGPQYDNAEDVGFFLGAIHAAARQITGDRDKQANIVKNIFSSIAGAVGATGPQAGVAASLLNGLTTAAVDDVVSRLNNGTVELRDALRLLAFPRDPRTNEPYEGAAETAYDSAVGRVIDANS